MLRRERYVYTELGQEKVCSQCRETWPNDGEFYGSRVKSKDGRLGICRACMSGRQYWKRRAS